MLHDIFLKMYFFMHNILNILSSKTSTYNLGIAISAFAIVVAFIEIISLKNNLKIRIYYKKKNLALSFAIISIFLSFIAEFFHNSFILNITAAVFMVASISLYLWLIYPIKNIRIKNIEKLKRVLDGFLPNKFAHGNSEIIKDVIAIFDDLLDISLKHKEAAGLFSRYFSSKIFLDYFSQSGYIFSKTLMFLLKNDSREVKYFFERLFLASLDNQDSYLNIFINEDIYPNTLDDFDIALLDNRNIIKLLDRLEFNISYSLNVKGQISFLKIVERYFSLIHNFNECAEYPKKENCKIKYKLNDDLVIFFFNSIEGILSSIYKASENEKKETINRIKNSLHSYNYCINFKQKSEVIRKKAGEFLYKLYEEMLVNYDLNNTEKEFEYGHLLYELYSNLTDRGHDKVAQTIFLEKLKEKIVSDEWGSNIRGWYPAIILIYWYLFGMSIFGRNTALNEPVDVHIEILSKLAEAFPKLYDGYIRNFYNAKTLPVEKKKYLKEKGQKILRDFLLTYMEYNRKENSLSYYFGFGDKISGGTKILLDKVKKDRKIDIIEI